MAQKKIKSVDLIELACSVVDIEPDDIEEDISVLDEKIYERFGCSLDQFKDISNRILGVLEV